MLFHFYSKTSLFSSLILKIQLRLGKPEYVEMEPNVVLSNKGSKEYWYSKIETHYHVWAEQVLFLFY